MTVVREITIDVGEIVRENPARFVGVAASTLAQSLEDDGPGTVSAEIGGFRVTVEAVRDN